VSIAPRAVNQPTPQTSFTDADLGRTRAPSAAGGATAAAVPVAADEEGRHEWAERIRDREDEVRQARSRARRVEAQLDALRARAAASASDFDAHQKVERELTDALDDLDKAEREVSRAERALDEAKEGARRAGFRVVEKE
jgi:molecular chaperone GrpE (heat shock protein)